MCQLYTVYLSIYAVCIYTKNINIATHRVYTLCIAYRETEK